MDLGTFGAILRFAMDLESRAEAFHGSLGRPEAAAAAAKRLRLLEQARREGVAEMILESIEGLSAASYASPLAAPGDALEHERTCARFYRDAGAKIPIREVVRLFGRLAGEHEDAARAAS